jgi:DNA-binding transcriptional LysR family regulator
MRFTLRQLEIFVAVARHENVSQAAPTVALSQSATSTALGELERQFDAPLFERIGKSLRLNSLGEALLPQAVELLERAAGIEALVRGTPGFGDLRIGATLTIGNYLATLIVAGFLRDYPANRVELKVDSTARIVDRIARHELDLGLIEGSARHPDLLVEPWVDDELTVFCHPQHRLANRRSVKLDALLDEDWIVREPGSGTRETFDQAMRHVADRLRIRLQLEHTEAIKRAVETGLGIGCLSRLALRDALRRGSLVALKTPELDLKRQFSIVLHRKKYQTAGLREFIARCRAMTAGVRRSDEIDLPPIA